MHSSESRLVIGPSNILFAGVYVCTFQPGNFTGWGSQGVKAGLGKTSRTTLGIKNKKIKITNKHKTPLNGGGHFSRKGSWGRQSWNKCVSFYIITCACLAPKRPPDPYRFLRCGVPVWPGDVSGHFAAHCTTLCFPFVRASGFLFVLFFVVERVPKLACV